MNKTKMSLKTIFMASLMLCLSIAAFAQPHPPQFDSLGRLKHALQEANAPALSTAQEDQLKALVQEAREANKPTAPDPAVKAAREAFDAAILAGDQAAASTQAGVLANLMATASTAHLKSQANYSIQALAVLKTNQAQIDALTQKVGANGIVRLVGSLFGGGPGGPGGFGGPGGPGGPGGFGPGGHRGPEGGRPGAPIR